MQANLGLALSTRFEALGQVADLDAAIAAYERALKALPSHHPTRPLVLLPWAYRLGPVGSGHWSIGAGL
ncbi:MAG: hypothetical protein Q9O62_11180 [Ardenticatenia bacterium]|nr:hypothetical protein [Ardenticatenia bacterium]